MNKQEDFTEIISHLRELTVSKDLEKRALNFAHNPLVTEPVRQLILDLWNAYIDVRWVSELLWEEHNNVNRERLRNDQAGRP